MKTMSELKDLLNTRFEKVVIETLVGDDLRETIHRAMRVSMLLRCLVSFEFNEREMEIDAEQLLAPVFDVYYKGWGG